MNVTTFALCLILYYHTGAVPVTTWHFTSDMRHDWLLGGTYPMMVQKPGYPPIVVMA